MVTHGRNRKQRLSSKILCAAVVAAPVVLTTSWFSGQAKAADLSWDSTSAGSASGGTGTWDVGNTWWNGTADQTWADGNNAIFAGSAGLVSINGSVAPSNMDFQTDQYYLVGGNIAASSVSVGSGASAEIDSAINGAGALTMNGPGTLVITSSSNTYSGGTNFNGGVLQANSDAALGGSFTNLTFNGGTLKWGAAFDLDPNRTIQLDGDGIFDTNGFDTVANDGSHALISGSGTFIKTGLGNYVYGVSGAAWNGKLVVKDGRWAATSLAALPNLSTATPDAITIDGGDFWADTGTGGTSNSNLGVYVTNNGGTMLMGLNNQTLTWTGSLTSQSSSSTLGINYGTVRFNGDISGYNGTFAINTAGDGQGRLIIDSTLNPGVQFAWGTLLPSSTNGHEIIINSNNPSITGNFATVNNSGILLAGPGTTNAFGDGSATNTISVANGTVGGGNGAIIPQAISFSSLMNVRGETGSASPSYAASLNEGDTVTFTGQITGTGDLHKMMASNVEPGWTGLFNTVVLAGAGGSWTGATYVDSGQLVSAAHNALPLNTNVTVSSSGQLTVAPGVEQTVGTITSNGGNTSGFVNIDSGATLTVGNNNGNSVIGRLTGSGTLYVVGTGTTDIQASNNNGSNWSFSGNFDVDGGTLIGEGAGYLGSDAVSQVLTIENGGTFNITGRYNSGRSMVIGAGGGTINTNALSTTGTSNTVISYGSSITGSGQLTEQGSNNLPLWGTVNLPGGMVLNGAGVQFSDASNVDGTVGDITGGAAQIDKKMTNNLTARSITLDTGNMQIEAGKITMQPRSVTGSNHPVYLDSVYIPSGSTLDLNDNDLVVNRSTNNPGYDSFTALQALVLGGHSATPDITKTGIISSVSQNTGGKTILELVDNSLVGYADWPVGSGHAVGTNAIIGKYTYYGDTNLDGAVTGDDYSAVDANLGSTPPAGKAILLGDTNFDGAVTGDDYSFIDADLGLGVGNQLAVSHLSAVPEPASLGLLALGGVGVLMRRRRRSK